MKLSLGLTAFCMLFIAACDFDVPLATEHTVRIDESMVGYWQSVPAEGEIQSAQENVLILKFSDTEYLVRHTQDDSELLFRAYPISVAGVACVQMQVLSMGEEAIADSETERFTVLSYAVENDVMVVRELNTDLLTGSFEDSKALQKSFKSHKDNPELFTNPITFRKFKL